MEICQHPCRLFVSIIPEHKEMTCFYRFVSRYAIWLSVALLLVVTLLSLWPVDQLPQVRGSDKLHHFLAYAAVMLPIGLRAPRVALVGAVLIIGWSGVIEILQPYVNRYGEWLDLLANAIGVCLGGLLAALWRRWAEMTRSA